MRKSVGNVVIKKPNNSCQSVFIYAGLVVRPGCRNEEERGRAGAGAGLPLQGRCANLYFCAESAAGSGVPAGFGFRKPDFR